MFVAHSPERKLKQCILPTCKGQRYDLVHKFPMNNERANSWLKIINVPELNEMPIDQVRKRYFICSKHFRKEDYKNCESRSLNKTAYPRLLLTLNDKSMPIEINISATDHANQPSGYLESVKSINNTIDLVADQILTQTTTLCSPLASSMDNTNEMFTTIEIVSINKPHSLSPVSNYASPTITETIGTTLDKDKTNEKQHYAKLIEMKNVAEIPKQSAMFPLQSIGETRGVYVNLKRVRFVPANSFSKKPKLVFQPEKCKTNELQAKEIALPILNQVKRLESDETNSISEMPAKNFFTVNHEELDKPLQLCNFWLRDHCLCDVCYSSDTYQRKINILDIPLDIEPVESHYENSTLCIKWSDSHESIYDILELKKMLSNEPNEVQPKLWRKADIESADYTRVTLNDYLCNDGVAKSVVKSLIEFGCAFIENVPANIQSTEIAIKRLFPVQRTLFGEMWSFSDTKTHSDSAYTKEELLPHNDNTYFNDAAGLQILHCVSYTGSGGENILVDGYRAAQHLREKHYDAYEYLCKTSIPAEYIEDGCYFKYCAPVINLDPVTNEPQQIRFNMNDRACLNNIPQTEVIQFYKFYRLLASELQSSQNGWHFKLNPGTVCIFDNWRLLHGRTSYTGRRQMVGCYVARSEFLSVARKNGLIK